MSAEFNGITGGAGAGAAGQSTQNILITKLPKDFKDDDLLGVFSTYGGYAAKVMLDAQTGVSKRFGFVQFPTNEQGLRCLQEMDNVPFEYQGTRCCFRVFPSKHNATVTVKPSTCLYVKNIPVTVPRNDVQAILSRYGTIEHVTLKPNRNGPTWYVTVTYDSIPTAEKALKSLHNQRLFPNAAPVMAKFADTEAIRNMRRERDTGMSGSQTTLQAAHASQTNLNASMSMDMPSRSVDFESMSESVTLYTSAIAGAVVNASNSQGSPTNHTGNSIRVSVHHKHHYVTQSPGASISPATKSLMPAPEITRCGPPSADDPDRPANFNFPQQANPNNDVAAMPTFDVDSDDEDGPIPNASRSSHQHPQPHGFHGNHSTSHEAIAAAQRSMSASASTSRYRLDPYNKTGAVMIPDQPGV